MRNIAFNRKGFISVVTGLACGVFLLSGCATYRVKQARHPLQPEDSFQDRGTFRVTYYTLPRQTRSSAYATVMAFDDSGRTVAWIDEPFRRQLQRFGQGRLTDGRVVVLLDTSDSRLRVRVLPPYRYGLSRENTYPLPYRTVAVDPHRILPGSVLFVPEAYGILLPGGEIHDGFFLAQDVRDVARNDRIAFFVPDGQSNVFHKAGLRPDRHVRVYEVSEPYESAILQRYAEHYVVQAEKPLYRMVAAEIDQLLRETSARITDVRQRLIYYSARARGTPYMIFLLGEGPDAPYDADPLIDFARVDCMTYCEQMLAMAISTSYRQMFHRLQRIRYRDGIIDFKTRNHYTIADWLPNNRWLLEDATRAIGGDLVKPMTKVIDRRAFFLSNGLPESALQDVPPPDTLTVDFLPAEHLLQIQDRLEGGEIVSIVSTYPGIFSAHMGIIVRDRYGNVIFRHGSSRKRKMKVIDERFEDVVASLLHSSTRVGMIFMRIRDDWRYPEASSDGEEGGDQP